MRGMMRIKPCHGCPLRKDCEQVKDFQQRARGLGAISVSFRCERLKERLPPGTRIMMSMPVKRDVLDSYEPEYQIIHVSMPATVLSISERGTFNAVMDRDDRITEDRFRWRKTGPISRIKAILDEPQVPLCEFGVLQINGECDRKGMNGGCLCRNMDDIDRKSTRL